MAANTCRCASASGSNTGPCVVGNMGSDFRFNYSVLGDTVNLASRLEARTKDYRLPMVIGSRTADMAKEKFAIMEIDLILVKGKKQPEAVFAVLGRAEVEQDRALRRVARPQRADAGALPQAGLGRRRWISFNAAARAPMASTSRGSTICMRSGSTPTALIRRGPDWDGVYEADSK